MNLPPNDRATARVADGGTVPLRPSGNSNGRAFVVSHGNNFPSDAKRWFWSLLLVETAVVVQEFRDHGRTPCGDLGSHPMPVMVRDDLRIAPVAVLDSSGRAA
ncbi:MAG: hypothetical protein OXF33_09285 [Rhodospirillales bacterium]|nr:hypothetical protein [Rhodospirillales bacterium]